MIVAITNPSRERSTRRPAQYRSFGPLYRFLYRFSADAEAIRWPTKPPPFPFRPAQGCGESVTTGCSKGEGADEPVCGAAHLTLPTLRLGASLSPLKGGEGLVPAGIILVERDASRAIKFSSPHSPAPGGGGLV